VYFSRFGLGRLALLLCAAGAFFACAGGPAPNGTASSQMYAHYGQVGEIQDAVVAGDVDATRGPARWLAGQPTDQYGTEGQDALDLMRAEALTIEHQTTIIAIGHSVARMGAACGACHTATGRGPQIAIGDMPPSSMNPGAHMVRHAWGADRLWEGLFAPSEGAWAAGTGALMSMSLDFGANERAGELAVQVHELSRKAQSAKDPQERAGVYGAFLETCSQCHTLLGMD
jgi:mono/diheme cytochrome c family protein